MLPDFWSLNFFCQQIHFVKEDDYGVVKEALVIAEVLKIIQRIKQAVVLKDGSVVITASNDKEEWHLDLT